MKLFDKGKKFLQNLLKKKIESEKNISKCRIINKGPILKENDFPETIILSKNKKIEDIVIEVDFTKLEKNLKKEKLEKKNLRKI